MSNSAGTLLVTDINASRSAVFSASSLTLATMTSAGAPELWEMGPVTPVNTATGGSIITGTGSGSTGGTATQNGTLAIQSASTYSGTLGTTLNFSAPLTFTQGTLIKQGTGTLTLQPGTFTAGSLSTGTQTLSGGTISTGTGTLPQGSILAFAGAQTVNQPAVFAADNGAGSGLAPTLVPEPGAAGLLALGALGFLARRRRQGRVGQLTHRFSAIPKGCQKLAGGNTPGTRN